MLKLLSARRFAALFWTQFFSAFNDNFLKNSLVFLIMAKIAAGSAETLITVAGGVFILPFFLLSGLGGELADRFDKSLVAQRLKLAEFWPCWDRGGRFRHPVRCDPLCRPLSVRRDLGAVRSAQIRHPA